MIIYHTGYLFQIMWIYLRFSNWVITLLSVIIPYHLSHGGILSNLVDIFASFKLGDNFSEWAYPFIIYHTGTCCCCCCCCRVGFPPGASPWQWSSSPDTNFVMYARSQHNVVLWTNPEAGCTRVRINPYRKYYPFFRRLVSIKIGITGSETHVDPVILLASFGDDLSPALRGH